MKKKHLQILSFSIQRCTISDNHMMYGSWDTECNRHDFLSFWIVFCPLPSLITQKIKILKNWKKHLEIGILILHKCTKNHDDMLYCSWDIAGNRCNCYFSFWTIFYLFLPRYLTVLKIKIYKKWKKTPGDRYHHFTQVYQKWWSYAIVPEKWHMTDVIKLLPYFPFWAIFCPFSCP